MTHSQETFKGVDGKRDKYFDILKLKPPKPKKPPVAVGGGGEGEKKLTFLAKLVKLVKLFHGILLELLDDLNDWLEDNSALFREVVLAVQEDTGSSSREDSPREEMSPLGPVVEGGARYGALEDQGTAPLEAPAAGGGAEITPAEPPDKVVTFDQRGMLLERALQLAPTAEQQQETAAYEEGLKEQANVYTSRLSRLAIALYYVFLSNNQYIPFFFLILSIIVNGSLLSLFYAVLLFAWGLLSVPWPSKRFWLTLIFYTMFVLVVKYAFQFYEIPYWMEHYNPLGGLYPPRLIGIEKKDSFVANAVVDILLLIFLLIHRGLLFVSVFLGGGG